MYPGFSKEASRCVIKAAAHSRVAHPWTPIVTRRRHLDGLNRLHRAAPWPKAVGGGCEARRPGWLQGRLAHGLHPPVLAGRSAHGSVLPVVLGDGDPPARAGCVSLEAQTLLQHLPAGCRSGGHHPLHPCRGVALMFLGDTSDRQEPVGRGSHQQLLEVVDRPPGRVRGGARETFLPASSMPCPRVPMAVSPWGGGGGVSPFRAHHRRTSPTIRTLLDVPPVRTTRTSAPWRVGSVRLGGPLRSLPGRRSLVPSSPPLCSGPLPGGRDPTDVGSRGLPQLLMKKHGWFGPVGVWTPVGVWDVVTPRRVRGSCPRTLWVMASQPLWPCRFHEVLRGRCTGAHPDRPSLVHLRGEAGRGRNLVPRAAHRG